MGYFPSILTMPRSFWISWLQTNCLLLSSFLPPFSVLLCFAPCPTSETMGITANIVLCVTACLVKAEVPGAVHGPSVLPFVRSCSAHFTFKSQPHAYISLHWKWSHCFEGRLALEEGSIFLAPFHFLWFQWTCMPICMYQYLQAFPPNIYFSCLFFMSHAYPVQFGFNSSSFFPVLCFTSFISKGIEYQTRPPTLSTLTSLLTGFCRALLHFSH